MSFYVYLPCMSSKATADFTISLPQSINVTSPMNCALCEVHRTGNITIDLSGEYYIIFKVTDDFKDQIDVFGPVKWPKNLRIPLNANHLRNPELLMNYVNNAVYVYLEQIYELYPSYIRKKVTFHRFLEIYQLHPLSILFEHEYDNFQKQNNMYMYIAPGMAVAFSTCLVEYFTKKKLLQSY